MDRGNGKHKVKLYSSNVSEHGEGHYFIWEQLDVAFYLVCLVTTVLSVDHLHAWRNNGGIYINRDATDTLSNCPVTCFDNGASHNYVNNTIWTIYV
jgi:hypothetical protein